MQPSPAGPGDGPTRRRRGPGRPGGRWGGRGRCRRRRRRARSARRRGPARRREPGPWSVTATATSSPHLDLDRRARRGVTDGVVDEVGHGPPHGRLVDGAPTGRRPADTDSRRRGAAASTRPRRPHRADQGHQVGRAAVDACGPGPGRRRGGRRWCPQPRGRRSGALEPGPVVLEAWARDGRAGRRRWSSAPPAACAARGWSPRSSRRCVVGGVAPAGRAWRRSWRPARPPRSGRRRGRCAGRGRSPRCPRRPCRTRSSGRDRPARPPPGQAAGDRSQGRPRRPSPRPRARRRASVVPAPSTGVVDRSSSVATSTPNSSRTGT